MDKNPFPKDCKLGNDIINYAIRLIVGTLTHRITMEYITPVIREAQIKKISTRVSNKLSTKRQRVRTIKRCCNMRIINIREAV